MRRPPNIGMAAVSSARSPGLAINSWSAMITGLNGSSGRTPLASMTLTACSRTAPRSPP